MKVLFIVPYPAGQAPSQRFRFEQYLEHLKDNGIDHTIEPFLDHKTWKILYSKGGYFQKGFGFFKGILKRLSIILSINNYDHLFIHREACPIGPAFFEWIYSLIFKGKIHFDFDDAIWLYDVSTANTAIGFLKMPGKTSSIIKRSHHVIAGNSFLKAYALQFNPRVQVIPTTIDMDYHRKDNLKQEQGKVIIGWTGTITTIKHFETAYSFLTILKKEFGDRIGIRVISNFAPKENHFLNIEYRTWNKNTEIEDLSSFHIGIMPLPDDPWTQGKCGFKGLQYMSLGIPCVMSPVGVNTEIIRDQINGYLATDDASWIRILRELINSEELRKKIGDAGKQTIADSYSVDSRKKDYLELFK